MDERNFILKVFFLLLYDCLCLLLVLLSSDFGDRNTSPGLLQKDATLALCWGTGGTHLEKELGVCVKGAWLGLPRLVWIETTAVTMKERKTFRAYADLFTLTYSSWGIFHSTKNVGRTHLYARLPQSSFQRRLFEGYQKCWDFFVCSYEHRFGAQRKSLPLEEV